MMQTMKMGMHLGFSKLLNTVNGLTGYQLKIKPGSLAAVAKRFNIPFLKITNPNSTDFLQKLRDLSPDLIVSYSAPVVFKQALLDIPKHGCINLHCSFLPHYAGVMPSFWTLFHKECETGVTVHYMDSKIDNGGILNQEKVAIDKGETMFSLIKKTKEIGGNLMCKTIVDIQNGVVKVKDNIPEQGSYFTWPTIEQFQKFTKEGGRLI